MLDRRTFIGTSVALGALAGADPAVAHIPDETLFAAVNRDIALDHIEPAYRGFENATHGLKIALAAYDDGDTSLIDAQQAFDRALDAWMAVQHLRLGPAQVNGRSFRVQFWPDGRNVVGRRLVETLEVERADLIEDPAPMAGASVAIQAFPGLERLLFEIHPMPGHYGAHLAAAIAANLAAIATELAHAWRPDGIWGPGLWDTKSSPDAYPVPSQATATLLLALVTQLDVIVQNKLRTPLGETIEEARPRLAESWRSARSLRNLRLNLDALIALYGGGDGRFALLLDDAGFLSLSRELAERLAGSRDATTTLPDALEPAATDETQRASLIEVAGDLDAARQSLSGTGAEALGLLLGFNSLDGD